MKNISFYCGTFIRGAFIILLFLIPLAEIFPQNIEKRVYTTRKTVHPPVIDGEIDEIVWQEQSWQGEFIQHEPFEGKKPSQDTEFAILYDDNFIYLAIRAYDSNPDSIAVRMDRRDNTDGDFLLIAFDSYHDLRTGFIFGVNAAGVRNDAIISNNGQNEDDTWDPIWYAKTGIYEWGWAAEIKIPFTQLRFEKEGSEVWGLEIGRSIFRKDELSLWAPVPRNSPGFIHLFGELAGLEGIKPKKQLDITPYTVATGRSYEPEDGNPYRTGKDTHFNAGLDAKIGVTNNLTLDLTINPDFGQVEADPSEVNLTAYETYFREKRPFFIEGNSITSFNVGLGDGDVGNDNLFYSRRIGRRPHGEVDLDDNEYASVPPVANILGAAKLTGKTKKGLSIGILESVTSELYANVDRNGVEGEEQIEPLTNYSLIRIKKDIDDGNTIIGGAVTSTIRRLNETDLQELHKNATTAGIDFTHYFKERNYEFSFSVYGSNVNGTKEAIRETQLSSARYFQRPDAEYMDYDPEKTSLNGIGGSMVFGKIGGNWNYLFLNTWKNPGLEINDMGFMREADRIFNVLWSGYSFTEPFGIFRSLYLNNDIYSVLDFGGNLNSLGYEAYTHANFKNFWSFDFGGGYTGWVRSNSLLRGGPSIKLPGNTRFFMEIESNDRKKLIAEISGGISRGQEGYTNRAFLEAELEYRIMNNLNLSVSPEYSTNYNELQYIDTKSYNGQDRYIFGTIDQKTLSLSLRLNYTIVPDLTIQYWGQPFISTGKYADIKRITDVDSEEFRNRYQVFNPNEISLEDGIYYIDENLDTDADYSFDNPDFSFGEWLSNLVIRWEFRPGSTAYLVWSQNRDYSSDYSEQDFMNNFDELYSDEKAENVFLLKFSWRFGL